MHRYEIIVEFKPEVLDPQARAIKESLAHLGYEGLSELKVSKRFIVELTGEHTDSKAESIARDVLANPVSESYHIRQLD